jgi:hypothetical protein
MSFPAIIQTNRRITRLTNASASFSICSVKFAKIHIEDGEIAAKALVGMAQRGRVIGLRDHVFIVPEPALDWLKENSLSYRLVAWLNQDDVVQALRNNLAHAA